LKNSKIEMLNTVFETAQFYGANPLDDVGCQDLLSEIFSDVMVAEEI